MRLFRDMRQDDKGVWRGKVYVPDIDKTFGGAAQPEGATLLAKGCLVGGLLCKTQVWTRLDSAE